MSGMVFITPLDGRGCDISVVGGKAINLSKMVSAGFRVPPAIAVNSLAYEVFLDTAGLRDWIGRELADIDYGDAGSIVRASSAIRDLILAEPIPAEVESEICAGMATLDRGYYAVRSSAVAEDLGDASFAGQQDTYLNVPAAEVPAQVRRCW